MKILTYAGLALLVATTTVAISYSDSIGSSADNFDSSRFGDPAPSIGSSANFDSSRFGDPVTTRSIDSSANSIGSAANFDSARFGDPVTTSSAGSTSIGSAANFDSGRFGDPVTIGGIQTTRGIEATPVKTQTITKDNPVVNSGNTSPATDGRTLEASEKAELAAAKKAEESKDEGVTDKDLTAEDKAELEKFTKGCGTASGQKAAASLANDDSALKASLGGNPGVSCMNASKKLNQLCSKGDVAGSKSAALTAYKKCQGDYDKYMQMNPTSDVAVDKAGQLVNPLDTIQETLKNNPISTLLGGASSSTNPFQQMMLGMIAQQLMGGGSSGNSNGTQTTSDGSTVACVASTTAAYQNPNGGYVGGMYCPAGTMPVVISSGSGGSGSSGSDGSSGGTDDTDDEAPAPTCDSVKTSTVSTTTTIEKDTAGKDVNVVTKVTTDTCANKNVRVKTQVGKTSADGTKVDTEQTTIKVPE